MQELIIVSVVVILIIIFLWFRKPENFRRTGDKGSSNVDDPVARNTARSKKSKGPTETQIHVAQQKADSIAKKNCIAANRHTNASITQAKAACANVVARPVTDRWVRNKRVRSIYD